LLKKTALTSLRSQRAARKGMHQTLPVTYTSTCLPPRTNHSPRKNPPQGFRAQQTRSHQEKEEQRSQRIDSLSFFSLNLLRSRPSGSHPFSASSPLVTSKKRKHPKHPLLYPNVRPSVCRRPLNERNPLLPLPLSPTPNSIKPRTDLFGTRPLSKERDLEAKAQVAPSEERATLTRDFTPEAAEATTTKGPLHEDDASPCNEEGPNVLTGVVKPMQRYKVSMKVQMQRGGVWNGNCRARKQDGSDQVQ